MERIEYLCNFNNKGDIKDCKDYEVIWFEKLKLRALQFYTEGISVSALTSVGWTDWKKSGQMCGPRGGVLDGETIKDDWLLAVKIKTDKTDKSIYYRVCAKNGNWSEWRKEGEICGSEALESDNILTGIQIFAVSDGSSADECFRFADDKLDVYRMERMEKIMFRVEYASAGADNADEIMEPTNVEYGVPTRLRKNIYIRKGFRFIGWKAYRVSDGKTCYHNPKSLKSYFKENSQPEGWTLHFYEDFTSVAALSSVNNDRIIMSAQWEKINALDEEKERKKDSKFILLIFPAGEKSMTRMGLWRECYDNEIDNAVIVDYSFWNMSLNEQINYIISLIDEERDNFIICCPGTQIPECIPEEVIKELKKRELPALKSVVIYLIDSLERMASGHRMTVNEFKNYFSVFDAIYTYDPFEAKKYGMIYAPSPLKKFDVKNKRAQGSKVFFIGRTKGRLTLLMDIAKQLEENEIDYEFLVLRDKTCEDLEDMGNIHFIPYLKYDLVVEKVAEASCLLSLPSKNAHMMSASYMEAVLYNKKVLTNCNFISSLPYYDSRYMRVINEISDLDIEWLKEEVEVDYHHSGTFSVKSFFKRIEEDYEKGYLYRCSELNKAVIQNGRSVVKFAYHFSKIGWVDDIENLRAVIQPYQMEALRIYNPYPNCSIECQVRQKQVGWQSGENKNGVLFCGMTGKSLPLTAVRMKVENGCENYKVFYRAYMKTTGWTKLCENNEVSGSISDDFEDIIMGMQIILVNNSMNNEKEIL